MWGRARSVGCGGGLVREPLLGVRIVVGHGVHPHPNLPPSRGKGFVVAERAIREPPLRGIGCTAYNGRPQGSPLHVGKDGVLRGGSGIKTVGRRGASE